jgi:hypothetical protein
MCNKLKSRLKSALKNFDRFIDAHVDTALQITTALKNILNSPVADVLSAILPGQLDGLIKNQLVDALDKAITALTIADTCKTCTDLNSKLACFVSEVKKLNPDLQNALLQKLASLISAHLHGQQLQQCLYDLYTQSKYTSTQTAKAS